MMDVVKKRVGDRWRSATVRECLWCKKEFLATVTETSKGYGRFCSRSCGAHYGNAQRKLYKLKCQIPQCGKPFESVRPDAKYCSPSCKRHQKAKKSKEHQLNADNHVYHLSGKIRKKYGRLPCLIKDCGCGWTEEFLESKKIVCDIHHITPKRKGGDDSFSNLVAVCPNAHRLADRGLIPLDRMITLEEYCSLIIP